MNQRFPSLTKFRSQESCWGLLNCWACLFMRSARVLCRDKLKEEVESFQIYHLKYSKYIICFAKYLNFAKIKAVMYFANSLNWIFRETNYIFGISRSPASKWYIICSCSKSLKFFGTSKNGLKSDYFAKIAHKVAKSKYFPNIFYDLDSPINFLFRRYIICWGNLSLSKIIGGGPPCTAASFYSAKLCI